MDRHDSVSDDPDHPIPRRSDVSYEYLARSAPVAQLDRANASGALGREFESLRARHFSTIYDSRGKAHTSAVAIHSAGFRTISAQTLDAAWTRSDFFDFGAVVIDHEPKDHIAASAFRQRFITLNLNENAELAAVVM